MSTIFCVAPGPSAAQTDLEMLRGARVIAVKWGFLAAPWCEALYATHGFRFYLDPQVVAWRADRPDAECYAMRGRQALADFAIAGVVELEHAQDYGLCRDQRGVAFGSNSGAGAVNLAFHKLPPRGRRRIGLVGYDMRQVEGRTHFHRDGANTPPWIYRDTFLPAFRKLAGELTAEGVEVFNCTPGSALDCFPFANLEDLI